MEEEFELLDWVEGEKRYIEKRVNNYLKEQYEMPLSFLLSDKKLNKNIEEIKREAKDYFRFIKLNYYEAQIAQERKRIDKLVEDINNKLNEYMFCTEEKIYNELKPFKIKTEHYANDFGHYSKPKEIVSIYCEPFEISFLQEAIE